MFDRETDLDLHVAWLFGVQLMRLLFGLAFLELVAYFLAVDKHLTGVVIVQPHVS